MSGEPLLVDEGGVNWRTAFPLPITLRRPADAFRPLPAAQGRPGRRTRCAAFAHALFRESR